MASNPDQIDPTVFREQDYIEISEYPRRNFFSFAFGVTYIAFATDVHHKYKEMTIDRSTMEYLWFNLLDKKFAQWSGDGRTQAKMDELLQMAKWQVSSEEANEYWRAKGVEQGDAEEENFSEFFGVEFLEFAKEAAEDEERQASGSKGA